MDKIYNITYYYDESSITTTLINKHKEYTKEEFDAAVEEAKKHALSLAKTKKRRYPVPEDVIDYLKQKHYFEDGNPIESSYQF